MEFPADLAGSEQLLLEHDVAAAAGQIFSGAAALLVDGYPGALLLDVRGWEARPVQSPPSEEGLRGPRDGFVETLKTNVTLVRRRLNDSHFQVEYLQVGRRSRTQIALIHMSDITPAPLLQEIRSRLGAVRSCESCWWARATAYSPKWSTASGRTRVRRPRCPARSWCWSTTAPSPSRRPPPCWTPCGRPLLWLVYWLRGSRKLGAAPNA